LHWFDEVTKSLAVERTQRATLLKGLGALAAGAFLGPFAGPRQAGLAQPRPGLARSQDRALLRVKGIPRPAPARLNEVVHGPCTFRFGPENSFSFSATSSSLELTMQHDFSPKRTSKSAPLSITGRFAAVITSGGQQLLHFQTQFEPVVANATNVPDATMTFRYGTRVRGLANAALAVRGGTLTGTIDGRDLRPLALRENLPQGAASTSDGRPVSVEIDAALRDSLNELISTAKSSLGTCRARISHPLRRARAIGAEPGTKPRLEAAVRRASVDFVVADSPDYTNVENQNGQGQGAGTHDCGVGKQDVMSGFGVCCIGVVAAAFFGGPAAAAEAYEACEVSAATAFGALLVPGAACNEVPCGVGIEGDVASLGFFVLPRSCDSSYTCCGDTQCCPKGDVCTPEAVCCPSTAPIGCGETRPFCCPPSFVCSNDQTCVGCPGGRIAHKGQCCDFLCGDDCCDSSEICKAGMCTPQPLRGGPPPATPVAKRNLCLPPPRGTGGVICRSLNLDGSPAPDVCCPAGMDCCAGKCCANPALPCCGRAAVR